MRSLGDCVNKGHTVCNTIISLNLTLKHFMYICSERQNLLSFCLFFRSRCCPLNVGLADKCGGSPTHVLVQPSPRRQYHVLVPVLPVYLLHCGYTASDIISACGWSMVLWQRLIYAHHQCALGVLDLPCVQITQPSGLLIPEKYLDCTDVGSLFCNGTRWQCGTKARSTCQAVQNC